MNDYTELDGKLEFGDEMSGGVSFEGELRGGMDMGGISVVCNTDYEELDNKPSIEGVELIGDRLLTEFGEKPLSNIEIKTIFDRVFRKD